jgi:hypothetical protein
MAIGRDYPDWGGYPVSGQTYPLKDLAELAARLGSPVTYDRSGAVYYLETFRDGLSAWDTLVLGAGPTPALNKEHSHSAGVSVKLDPGTVTGDRCSIFHVEPCPPLSKWGFACRVSTWSICGVLELDMEWADREYRWDVWLTIDLQTSTLSVLGADGAMVNVATIPPITNDPRYFSFLKAVIDPEAHTWCRVRLNSATYDVSGIGLYRVEPLNYDYVQLYIQATSQGYFQKPFWVDDVVMTYNES